MPTPKQRKAAQLISESIKSDNPQPVNKLLEEAGYAPSTAARSTQVMRSKTFREELEERGVTDKKLSQVLDEGLEANKVISAKIVGKNADEATDDFIEVPDHPTRHKFLETAIKIKGHVQPEPAGNIYNTYVQQNNINPNTPEAKELVDSTLEMLMERTKRNDG